MASPIFDLSGHVAVVTGGNSGIGLGMADALAAHGAAVSIWGTNATKNAAAAEQLRSHGGEVLDLVCDVGEQEEVVNSFQATVEQLGRVDSCFVNAGVSGKAPSFVGMTDEEWHRVMRVNLDGAFYTSQEAVKQMIKQGDGGSVVFTTSGSALYGQQRGQHYGGSKAALISMTKAIAVEEARYGIRCNSILPGWIESAMTAPAFEQEKFVDKVLSRVPVRRWGKPADFGGMAVYFASSASSYHTGDVVTIDGGYHSF
ncbi:MAG: 2-deoxy-D-gluconate 3-dehydrogenase [Ilumatobacteraceae bacterium]|nr:2-deoxy-D-gluconate 3-dehydrogenase [Ilumatobacteraceae bacterium]